MVGKNENLIFHEDFLNMDISITIPCRAFKSETCIHGIWMEGTLPQNFDFGLSFYFMKCRNVYIHHIPVKFPPFNIAKC